MKLEIEIRRYFLFASFVFTAGAAVSIFETDDDWLKPIGMALSLSALAAQRLGYVAWRKAAPPDRMPSPSRLERAVALTCSLMFAGAVVAALYASLTGRYAIPLKLGSLVGMFVGSAWPCFTPGNPAAGWVRLGAKRAS